MRTAACARVRASLEEGRRNEIDSRVLKVSESNSKTSAANGGARGGGRAGAAGSGYDRDHDKERSTEQRIVQF